VVSTELLTLAKFKYTYRKQQIDIQNHW